MKYPPRPPRLAPPKRVRRIFDLVTTPRLDYDPKATGCCLPRKSTRPPAVPVNWQAEDARAQWTTAIGALLTARPELAGVGLSSVAEGMRSA